MAPLTPVGLALLTLALLVVLGAPRRLALVAMLLVTCYLPLFLGVMLGPFNFFAIRLVILVGLIRILLRGEYRALWRNPLDQLMAVWSIWALVASLFRHDPGATLIYNGGIVFNYLGVYILLRSWCRSMADVVFLCRIGAWLLVPIAIEMVYEKLIASNLFSMLGGVSEVPEIRGGRIRAQGPFAHSIMAGSVGATMLPLCIGLWNCNRGSAIVGVLASTTMVFASASSGPLMSAMFATLGLLFWSLRRSMRLLRWSAVSLYLLLMVIMKSPPYYLIGRIDLAGGSTGWHRSRLIESSIEHLSEWWFVGTDYTRHWMPTGVSWSPNHTDITNQYILIGVHGGLPLTLIFILLLAMGFSIVGRSVRLTHKLEPEHAFFSWALGASLFAQAVTFISIAYIDQSFVFLFITLAAIAGLSASDFLNPSHRRAHPSLGRAVLRVRRSPILNPPLSPN